ncbi:MAG: hypothetical protein WAN11_18390 [Syntrophobacteraceae bacterium]
MYSLISLCRVAADNELVQDPHAIRNGGPAPEDRMRLCAIGDGT